MQTEGEANVIHSHLSGFIGALLVSALMLHTPCVFAGDISEETIIELLNNVAPHPRLLMDATAAPNE